MCHATMTWEEHYRQRKQQMQERTFAICAISFPCKEGNFAICDHMDLEGIMLTTNVPEAEGRCRQSLGNMDAAVHSR